jgi:hypothetical protein
VTKVDAGRMSESRSPEERRKRLDRLIDEASMMSFPASDPPAVFVDEPGPSREGTTPDADIPRGKHGRLSLIGVNSGQWGERPCNVTTPPI